MSLGFADDTVVLTVAENQSGHEMIFTPPNPNYKTVTSTLPVTVQPRKLVIRPDLCGKGIWKDNLRIYVVNYRRKSGGRRSDRGS